MRLSKLAWAGWALVPVAALAFHYGPGQKIYRQDLAASLQASARQLEEDAQKAQAEAYARHLAALEARRRSFVENTPEAEAAASVATDAETSAFVASGTAWKAAADAFGRIQEVAQEASPEMLQKIRWSRSRALVRSGDIWTGIAELEDVLVELEGSRDTARPAGRVKGAEAATMAQATREELASAYYYGARLMRLSGEPEEEWRVDSGKARQHFRYLAENAQESGQPKDVVENHQRNVELVLDLEQSSVLELQGKAIPRDSPGRRNGNRPGNQKGKTKRPPQNRDGRGAGGAEDIFTGW